MFDSGMDALRKEGFREAAKYWQLPVLVWSGSETCVVLLEITSIINAETAYLGVGAASRRTCSFRYDTLRPRITLGFCSSIKYKGNMIHEIGHAMGMSHEQQRPDSSFRWRGHGPWIETRWQHIDAWKVRQWLPENLSYTGSGNDGEDDPHSGYAPYDYESIMHYSKGRPVDRFEPTSQRGRSADIGQRLHLSAGDVLQILDAWQCNKKSAQ
jgi:hypothetical protein